MNRDLAKTPPARSGLRGSWAELVMNPIFAVLLASGLLVVWVYGEYDATTADILRSSRLWRQTGEHLLVTFWSTLLVLVVAIPLGIALTRPGLRRLAGPFLTVATSGQAIPAYGLIILFYVLMGTGTTSAVVALATFAVLPVLRNTMVGLDQVDKAIVEAGRGMGLSRWRTLVQIELPLAVPVILAGVRTALVINVGMASLVFLIGAGGLGETINSGLKLQRETAIFVGGALVALLALVVDFLAGLLERFLRPKGL